MIAAYPSRFGKRIVIGLSALVLLAVGPLLLFGALGGESRCRGKTTGGGPSAAVRPRPTARTMPATVGSVSWRSAPTGIVPSLPRWGRPMPPWRRAARIASSSMARSAFPGVGAFHRIVRIETASRSTLWCLCWMAGVCRRVLEIVSVTTKPSVLRVRDRPGVSDFDAIAEHLLALQAAAAARNGRIARVFFAPDLQERLVASSNGREVQQAIGFDKQPSWVRHDDHYRVDFSFSCEDQ